MQSGRETRKREQALPESPHECQARSLKERWGLLDKPLGFFNVMSGLAVGTKQVVLVIEIAARFQFALSLDDRR